jgi:hypothetical protein
LTVNDGMRGAMFGGFIPKLKIGCLQPGAMIDNAPYEFYRLATATAACSQPYRN